MPTVTVTLNRDGSVNVVPPVVTTNPGANGLTVTWNIINNAGVTLANPPVVFPWPVPSSAPPPTICGSWSEYTGPVTGGSGPNQWEATMPTLGSGGQECYKYSIVWTTGSYDPEVENQGPPIFEEEDPKKGTPTDRP